MSDRLYSAHGRRTLAVVKGDAAQSFVVRKSTEQL